MQNQFQPEENRTPQSASLAAPQTSLAAETEAETQTAQAFTKRLNAITKRANRAKRWFYIHWGVGFVCFLILPIPLLFLLGPHNPYRIFPMLFSYFAGFISLLLAMVFRSMMTPKFDADELARLGGPASLPVLCAVYKVVQDSKRREEVRNAIKILLPQMKASDARLVTPAMRQTLHIWLGSWENLVGRTAFPDDLRIAALKALEQVGDAKSIPIVERLAQRLPRTDSETAVRKAALECLPMLRANCGEVDAARTLLRAAHAEDARPDTLLRPASHAAQTNAAELLRGAEPPGDGEEGNSDD